MEITPIVYRGAKEICRAVGINFQDINHFVKNKGLPAFKIDGHGTWIALPTDLQTWIEKQKRENLKK